MRSFFRSARLLYIIITIIAVATVMLGLAPMVVVACICAFLLGVEAGLPQ